MTQLPSPAWPVPTARTPDLPDHPRQAVINSRRVLAGMTWPEDGHPGFVCVITERPIDISKKMDVILPSFEIVKEYSAATFPALTIHLDTLKDYRCSTIYTDLDRKYYTFVRDFNAYKRSSGSSLHLKSTRSSSFESALLKIKDIIMSNRIRFPSASLIRSQLSAFSKADLKNETQFYAIRSMAMVVDSFTAATPTTAVAEVPHLSSWY